MLSCRILFVVVWVLLIIIKIMIIFLLFYLFRVYFGGHGWIEFQYIHKFSITPTTTTSEGKNISGLWGKADQETRLKWLGLIYLNFVIERKQENYCVCLYISKMKARWLISNRVHINMDSISDSTKYLRKSLKSWLISYEEIFLSSGLMDLMTKPPLMHELLIFFL